MELLEFMGVHPNSFKIHFYGNCDEFPEDDTYVFRVYDPVDHSGMAYMRAFHVLRKTPAGIVIDHYGTEKFINLSWTKRFAHKTRRAAFHAYVARKRKQVKILTAQLETAKRNKALASKLWEKYFV